jgi:hypothetical protein
MTLDQLEDPDLFPQFVTNPEGFLQFVRNYWDDVYTLMLVSQL